MINRKLFAVFITCSALLGCSGEQSPVASATDPASKPKAKKIKSRPCSDYNLKFYQGDEREFAQTSIRIGAGRSDAKVRVDDRDIVILGFDGHAEEYVNYSVYRGFEVTTEQDHTGAQLKKRVDTQLIVCFRKNAIAVWQLTESTRSRGQLSKSKKFERQWLWHVES